MYHDRNIEPDLSRPTAHGLLWLLRNEDKWPKGFTWNYASACHCAMGLAQTMWPKQIRQPIVSQVAPALGISEDAANYAFLGGFLSGTPFTMAFCPVEACADALERRLPVEMPA
jgi:hypothetical protein